MPREVHEHWSVDVDDPENQELHKLTGYTVITRESPWDDKTRDRAMKLTEYEESVCTCGCGLPREIAHKKQTFKVDTFLCYAGQAIDGIRRVDREKHKDDDNWFEGRHYFAVPAREADPDN